jgi:hypothetical protein
LRTDDAHSQPPVLFIVRPSRLRCFISLSTASHPPHWSGRFAQLTQLSKQRGQLRVLFQPGPAPDARLKSNSACRSQRALRACRVSLQHHVPLVPAKLLSLAPNTWFASRSIHGATNTTSHCSLTLLTLVVSTRRMSGRANQGRLTRTELPTCEFIISCRCGRDSHRVRRTCCPAQIAGEELRLVLAVLPVSAA